MEHTYEGANFKVNTKDLCILNSGTTHSILKHKKYFSDPKPIKTIINIISGPTDLIEGYGKAKIVLLNGTKLFVNDALFSSKSKRNLLSFNDIYLHGYNI